MTEVLVNINGNVLPKAEAKISVFDRSFLFGDSVYEVIGTYNEIPFLLDQHLDRLYNSAQLIFMPIKWKKDKVRSEIMKTLEDSQIKQAYIRVIVTRGESEPDIDPNIQIENNIVIIVKARPDNPDWWYKKGVKVKVATTLRNDSRALNPNIKSGNYLNNILAINEANKAGAFEAIMLNHEGMVTEATVSNVWMVKNKTIITSPLDSGILKGITREALFDLMKKNSWEYQESNFTPDEMKAADECFLTSSTREIIPIITVDETKIGNGQPGPQTLKLLDLYLAFIQQECPRKQ